MVFFLSLQLKSLWKRLRTLLLSSRNISRSMMRRAFKNRYFNHSLWLHLWQLDKLSRAIFMMRAFTSFCTNERLRVTPFPPCSTLLMGKKCNCCFIDICPISDWYMSNTIQPIWSSHVYHICTKWGLKNLNIYYSTFFLDNLSRVLINWMLIGARGTRGSKSAWVVERKCRCSVYNQLINIKTHFCSQVCL